MDVDDRLNQLSRRLSRQGMGPIDTIADETISRLVLACTSAANRLRQIAADRPLITLLLACQVGYLIARMRRRHARH
jgi:hypothetical protein